MPCSTRRGGGGFREVAPRSGGGGVGEGVHALLDQAGGDEIQEAALVLGGAGELVEDLDGGAVEGLALGGGVAAGGFEERRVSEQEEAQDGGSHQEALGVDQEV